MSLFTFLFGEKPTVASSELSNPKKGYYKPGSKNFITERVLREDRVARDDEEYFLNIVDVHCFTKMDIVKFDRAFRLLQNKDPLLRGEKWEERQHKAELYKKNIGNQQ